MPGHAHTVTSATRLLLVLDGAPASRRAVAYTGRMVGARAGVHLCLAMALPPLPPRLLEFRGAEDPEEEQRLDTQLKSQQLRFTNTARRRAERERAAALAQLRACGVPAESVETVFLEAADGTAAADCILALARKQRCRTVVIGHQPVSWFRELIGGDLAETLVRTGRGVTIWVVD